MSPPSHLANYSAYLQLMRVHRPIETVQETLARSRWWKTQPPKSPLSGGLSTQFPPDKGG